MAHSVVLGNSTFNVTVYLPHTGCPYYNSSRFDWGSMIGRVRFGDHMLFGDNMWRQPHDAQHPEAGVGLASEFGCGEDGARCNAGWGAWPSGATNGVLGYEDGGANFLKIGVGLLKRGSCDLCDRHDPSDGYRFNSRYRFAAFPEWTSSRIDRDTLTFEHTAVMNNTDGQSVRWGYRLTRTISTSPDTTSGSGGTLRVSTRLENLGAAFTTPQYSHSLLSADQHATGPPWRLTLPIDVSSYKDAGSWAAPLRQYFNVEPPHTLVATATFAEPTKAKAIFARESGVGGVYSATFGDRFAVRSHLEGPLPLFAYNLYAERATLSPEPLQMIHLERGGIADWTHSLTFELRPELLPQVAALRSAHLSTADTATAPNAMGVASAAWQRATPKFIDAAAMLVTAMGLGMLAAALLAARQNGVQLRGVQLREGQSLHPPRHGARSAAGATLDSADNEQSQQLYVIWEDSGEL